MINVVVCPRFHDQCCRQVSKKNRWNYRNQSPQNQRRLRTRKQPCWISCANLIPRWSTIAVIRKRRMWVDEVECARQGVPTIQCGTIPNRHWAQRVARNLIYHLCLFKQHCCARHKRQSSLLLIAMLLMHPLKNSLSLPKSYQNTLSTCAILFLAATSTVFSTLILMLKIPMFTTRACTVPLSSPESQGSKVGWTARELNILTANVLHGTVAMAIGWPALIEFIFPEN